MKKILFLLLICLIKLNAYEYIIEDLYNITGYNYRISFVNDVEGYQGCVKIYDYRSGEITYTQTNKVITNFGEIKFQANKYYVKKVVFDNWLKSDLQFLNDLYTTNDYFRNGILNYLYNENEFIQSNYINYENYQILYNDDGLAVESIVNGVWAGLYDDGERGVSGRLYSSGGQLLYVNGKPINWMESQLITLMEMVKNSLRETVAVLGSLVPCIVAAVFVLVILYFVVWMGRNSVKSTPKPRS